MMKSTLRLGVCGTVLGAVWLGLATSAMAWNEPLWVRQLGTGNWTMLPAWQPTRWKRLLGGIDRWLARRSSSRRHHAWVAKYDTAGRVMWKRQLGTEAYDGAVGVATDAAGNVYITGGPRLARRPLSGGLVDAWVAKYDAAGRVVWKRQVGTRVYDNAFGVATDAAGNVYSDGIYRWLAWRAQPRTSMPWVAKVDAAGDILWKRQLGTAEQDYATGVATDAAGNAYLTGVTDGSLGGPNRGFRRWVGGEGRHRRTGAVEAAARNNAHDPRAAWRRTPQATST